MKAVIPAAGEGKRFNKDSTYMTKCKCMSIENLRH